MPRKKQGTKQSSGRKSRATAPGGAAAPARFTRLTRVAIVAWAVTLSALVAAAAPLESSALALVVTIAVAAAAFWLVTRTRRPGACAAVVCGIAGMIAGIAFGPGHLIWAGVTWRAVAGLILLAAAMVLVFAGSGGLTAGLTRGRRLLVGLALAVLVILPVWMLTPAVLATNPPHIPPGKTAPEDFGLTAREVQYLTSDGVQLGAWYVPSTNGAAVILRHGAGSTGSDILAHAAALAPHGYGVLVTDARGHGRSDGRGMEFGWYGDEDIAAAISFLLAQPDVESGRIGVVGLSMGGEEALGAAAGDSRIAAVVAEGATGRTAADKSWLPDVYGWRGRVQQVLERVQYWTADLLTPASPPVSLADAALDAAPTPVLLIAAGDVADEGHAATLIQSLSPGNVTVWTVPGAGHTQGLTVAPARWEETVVDFLDAALA